MEELLVPRVMISGVHAGVGKSLLTLGIAFELRRRNVSVSCVLIGPRLSQAVILHRVSGRFVHCLDEKLLSQPQNLACIYHSGLGADIVLIEGKNGLFDGYQPGSLAGSDAEIACISHTPVLLVVDAENFGSSLAALVKGYTELIPDCELVGTIINRLKTADDKEGRNREFFQRSFEAFGVKNLVGVLPELDFQTMLPPALITQEKNATSLPLQFFVDLGQLVASHIDIEAILALAKRAGKVPLKDYVHTSIGRRCRIAVTEDSCFSLCFQDNLELLRHFGAEVVTFSPLADSSLPKKIGAVYFTGAYLNEYGEELARNTNIRKALIQFAEAGGVIYSEGGGTAYLCKDFRCADHALALEGVGLIQASAVQDTQGFSYDEIVTVEESILGRPGLIFKGVSTGEWKLRKEERVIKTLRVSRSGKPTVHDGYSPGAQVLSTFSFAHFGSNPLIAKNLADSAEVVERLG